MLMSIDDYAWSGLDDQVRFQKTLQNNKITSPQAFTKATIFNNAF